MNAAHAGATLAFLLAVAPASAQNVKITPVGSHRASCARTIARSFLRIRRACASCTTRRTT